VIATGQQHSVRELVELAGRLLGFEIEWRAKGTKEHGIDRNTGKLIVQVDPRYFRPTEVETLLGDASKAKSKLGWTASVSFEEIVREMVTSDALLARRDAVMAREGFRVYPRHE